MDSATLEKWVNINSGSLNREGLHRMADALEEELRELPGTLERLPLPEYTTLDGHRHQPGDAVRFRFRPEAPLRVLFSGHMDTVYGPAHPFQILRKLEDGKWNGPGVADMKGGLFIMIEAVRRFLREDTDGRVGGEILITADEEVGSMGSRPLLVEAAAWNHLGLVFESSLPGGELVRCRKGTGVFKLVAHGKAAHTGRDFQNGRNAIVALASMLPGCHQLNESIGDAIVNVGTVSGGGTVNVVPDLARAWLNIRIGQSDTAGVIEDALDELAAAAMREYPGTRIVREGGFQRAPREETPGNARLHEFWNEAEQSLGLEASGKRDTGGSSDGNLLGEEGLPHLDGVGIRGGSIHSPEEFAFPESIEGQVARTVAFLKLLSEHPERLQEEAFRGARA